MGWRYFNIHVFFSVPEGPVRPITKIESIFCPGAQKIMPLTGTEYSSQMDVIFLENYEHDWFLDALLLKQHY